MPRGKSTPAPQYKYAVGEPTSVYRGTPRQHTVYPGTIWHAECDEVRDYPSLFADEPQVVYPLKWTPPAPVEQATAAPGELRNTGRGEG